jgi:hypothetical protein
MDLIEELAQTYASALQKRADIAPDLIRARDEFENSAMQEQIQRRHAQRLQELADQRASREDRSLGGYASTALKRLAPVPHTGVEAAVRIPAMVAGGVAGHQFGKSFEGIDPDALDRVFAPGSKGLSGFEEGLRTLGRKGLTQAEASPLVKDLAVTPGSTISDALKERHIPGLPRPGAGIRSRLVERVGEEGMPGLRALTNKLTQGAAGEKGAVGGFKGMRMGGMVGGALAGGAVAGLPFVIRALMQKRHGGEAAVRARSQSSHMLQNAEGQANHREELLNKLPGGQA